MPFNNVLLGTSGPSAPLLDGGAGGLRSTETTSPRGGTPWTAAGIDHAGVLESVACPSIALCVALDSAGETIVGETLTDGEISARLSSAIAPALAGLTSSPSSVNCTTRWRSCEASTVCSITASVADQRMPYLMPYTDAHA